MSCVEWPLRHVIFVKLSLQRVYTRNVHNYKVHALQTIMLHESDIMSRESLNDDTFCQLRLSFDASQTFLRRSQIIFATRHCLHTKHHDPHISLQSVCGLWHYLCILDFTYTLNFKGSARHSDDFVTALACTTAP